MRPYKIPHNQALGFKRLILTLRYSCRNCIDSVVCLVRGGAGRRGGEGRCRGESGGRDAAEEGRRRRNNRSVPQTAAAGLTRKIWTNTTREYKEEPMKGGRAHF